MSAELMKMLIETRKELAEVKADRDLWLRTWSGWKQRAELAEAVIAKIAPLDGADGMTDAIFVTLTLAALRPWIEGRMPMSEDTRWKRIGSTLWCGREAIFTAGRSDNDEKKVAQALNLIVEVLNENKIKLNEG